MDFGEMCDTSKGSRIRIRIKIEDENERWRDTRVGALY